jgi:hypothetical protein
LVARVERLLGITVDEFPADEVDLTDVVNDVSNRADPDAAINRHQFGQPDGLPRVNLSLVKFGFDEDWPPGLHRPRRRSLGVLGRRAGGDRMVDPHPGCGR